MVNTNKRTEQNFEKIKNRKETYRDSAIHKLMYYNAKRKYLYTIL